MPGHAGGGPGGLADLMVEKGVVTREELHLVREGARAAPGVSRHEMWHVPDVDEL